MHSNVVCPALPLQIERRKKRGAAKEGVDPTTLGHPFRSLNARGNRYRPCRELRRPLSKRGPLFQSCTAVCVSCFLPLLPRRVSYIPPSDWIFLPEKGRYFIVIEVRRVFFFNLWIEFRGVFFQKLDYSGLPSIFREESSPLD